MRVIAHICVRGWQVCPNGRKNAFDSTTTGLFLCWLFGFLGLFVLNQAVCTSMEQKSHLMQADVGP